MGNLFKKSKAAVENYVGSVSGDANAIGSQLKSKLGSKEALSNTFDQRIADGLSDLLTGATGIRTSNLPEISDEVMKSRTKNREERAKVLNGAMTRAGNDPAKGVMIKFPENFLNDKGEPAEMVNYIHFRSKTRPKAEPGEKVYDIFLYIPDNLTDNLQVEYEEAEKGLMESVVGSLFTEGNEMGMSKEEFKRIMIEGAPGSAILKQAAGQIVNPMKFQLLKGVNFRTYSYDFILRPKNTGEADTIRQMVHAFRESALPGVTGDNDRIYTFPNEWAIRFHGPFKDYIDYPLISVCTGVDVDFTGGQSFQAMIDGAPTAISLKLAFTESTTLNRKKYAEGASAFINKGTDNRETYQDTFKGIVTQADKEEAIKTNRNTELKKRQKEIEDMEDDDPAKKTEQQKWINDYNKNNPEGGEKGMAEFLGGD